MVVAYAWVDESIHLDAAPGGIYVLAATICDVDAGLTEKRDLLRTLVPARQSRLHWHTESDTARTRIIESIAGLGLGHLAVVRVGVDPKRQERARRKCMERLLFELSQRGVEQVWLESRDRKLNRSDADLVEALRGPRTISVGLRVEFARPLDEPLLWMPDAVAGAVALAGKGRNLHYRERVAPFLEEIEI